MKNAESMLFLDSDALLLSLMSLFPFTPFQETCFNLAPLIQTCNGIFTSLLNGLVLSWLVNQLAFSDSAFSDEQPSKAAKLPSFEGEFGSLCCFGLIFFFLSKHSLQITF